VGEGHKIDESYQILKQIQGKETVGANLGVRPIIYLHLLFGFPILVPESGLKVYSGRTVRI